MTSDGIPTAEWDLVHQLAVDIANAALKDDTAIQESRTEELRCYLAELRTRHGDLPSILGTLADYSDDEAEAYELYALAIGESQRIGDRKNELILTESISELESLDTAQRCFWQSHLSELKKQAAALSDLC